MRQSIFPKNNFDKDKFAGLLQKSKGSLTIVRLSHNCGISISLLSKYLNKSFEKPPTLITLYKIGSYTSSRGVSFEELAMVSGYSMEDVKKFLIHKTENMEIETGPAENMEIETKPEDVLGHEDCILGARMRQIRHDHEPGLSQVELGKMVHLSGDRIQKYENGARSPKSELLSAIADALGVDEINLIGPSASEPKSLIYFLFDMENCFDLSLMKDSVNGRIYFCFGRDKDGEKETGLNELLNEWYLERQNYLKRLDMAYTPQEKEEISRRYRCWKYDFAKEIDAVMGKLGD